MTKAEMIKELNALELLAYAIIGKAEKLRLALGVSVSGSIKKRTSKDDGLSEIELAKILGRRRKYYEKLRKASEARHQ